MTKIRTLAGITLLSIALLGVAACSDGGATGTTPSSGSASSTSPAAQGERAPQVADPLDPAGLVDHPCESLSAEQLSDLGIEGEGKETRVTAGGLKGCDWKFGANLEWKIQVSYVVPDSRNGLQNEYDQHAAGLFEGGYFVPTSTGGYPGVFSNVADTRSQGRCDLGVGINDEMLLTVAVTGQAEKDNCRAASNVAERIISTIKAGGH
ncbi:DUF3558 domain-containing protein [Amycolatopsis thermoflava]|uniref:DUF3558 domain-containing protein n=1 Tax=Amycolatopsis thermoflava TaxID=84480 RepID=UPI000A009A6F|nr:DUF3558 domain-containing protein [Amycolatopsis thermoflava]